MGTSEYHLEKSNTYDHAHIQRNTIMPLDRPKPVHYFVQTMHAIQARETCKQVVIPAASQQLAITIAFDLGRGAASWQPITGQTQDTSNRQTNGTCHIPLHRSGDRTSPVEDANPDLGTVWVGH